MFPPDEALPRAGKRHMPEQEKILRIGFLVGAVTDAGALVPLLFPPAAKLLWGFDDPSGAYRFAMGYAASLMLGWTALLLWAYQRPLERRFVAALTVLVIYGLIATEVAAVAGGHLEFWRMLPTWILQGILLLLSAGGFHHAAVRRLAGSFVDAR
jgi:hypothetical protein